MPYEAATLSRIPSSKWNLYFIPQPAIKIVLIPHPVSIFQASSCISLNLYWTLYFDFSCYSRKWHIFVQTKCCVFLRCKVAIILSWRHDVVTSLWSRPEVTNLLLQSRWVQGWLTAWLQECNQSFQMKGLCGNSTRGTLYQRSPIARLKWDSGAWKYLKLLLSS